MRKALTTQSSAIVSEELTILERVISAVEHRAGLAAGGATRVDYDADLVALRDQIADEKPEDHASLVEQMTRIASLASSVKKRAALPIDALSPYFAHMRLRVPDRSKKGQGQPNAERTQDILIGRRGLIDREAGVQIVDWRDAPVSQVYYRYDEGDDYDEQVGSSVLTGLVVARRNVAISNGILRRVGCPQGTFVGSLDGQWYELEGSEVALLEGGQGTAARAPKLAPRRRMETARTHGSQKSLPEIAALIDPEQFALITAPDAGLIVIQGGAGSGKTTVALHRIAYLVFEGRGNTFKPSRCLFVVPSDALARYVAGVLPALGVQGVPVVTFRSWARTLRQRLIASAPNEYSDETPSAVSRLKKHPGMLTVLEALLSDEMKLAGETLARELAGAEGLDEISAWWQELSARAPISRVRRMKTRVGKGTLPPTTIHRAEPLLRAMTSRLLDLRGLLFEALTDRTRLGTLATWPVEPATASEIEELVRWCAAQLEEGDAVAFEGIDEERLQTMDGRAVDDSQQGHAARGKSDEEDDALLLRLYQIVHGHLERVDGEPLVYDHIALDEAQDFSPVEVKLLYAATDERRSFTIAGDVAQRVVFDNAFRGWQGVLSDLGIADAAHRVRPLALSYRSTAQVMRFARAILGPLASELSETAARQGAEVSVHAFDGMGEAVAFVADALRSLLARESLASVALIARHGGQADAWFHALARAEVPHLRRVRRQEFSFEPGIDITDATQVKGLEFDYVLLLDVTDASYADNVEARHLLHIGATRATHQLWVIVTGRPSPLLAGVANAAEVTNA